MQEPYTEITMSCDGFVRTVETFLEYFLRYFTENLKKYTKLECSYNNKLIKIGSNFVIPIKKNICEYEWYKKNNTPPSIEFYLDYGPDSKVCPGLGFYHDCQYKVHTVNLTYKQENYSRFREFIHFYYYHYPEFLLKSLKSAGLVEAIIDSFIYQLAWVNPEFKSILLQNSSLIFRYKLSKELKIKDFITSFFNKGFTINNYDIYVNFTPQDNYFQPDGNLPLLVKEEDEEEVLAYFDRDRKQFFRLDNGEKVEYYHLWRYQDRNRMDKLLKKNGLGKHSKYLFYGKELAAEDYKPPPYREVLNWIKSEYDL